MLIPLVRFLMMNSDNTDVTGGSTVEVDVVDTSVYDAKISELTGVVAERDATIATMTETHAQEVQSLKSANYDLLKSLPADGNATSTTDNGTTEIDSNVVTPNIDDLFEDGK